MFFSFVSNKEALEFSRMKAAMMQASLSLRAGSSLVLPWNEEWVGQGGAREEELEMQEMEEDVREEEERCPVLVREEHMDLQELEEIDLG